MKQKIKIERILEHGPWTIEKVTDNFGNWHYGLFYNKQWREWSWDFAKLRDKAYS